MKLTILLIILNVFAFLYTLVDLDYYIDNYGFSTERFLAGHYEVLLTSMFLHSSLIHLGGNMLFLFFLGWTIEKNSKLWQYILAYFLSGIAGAFSMFLLPPDAIAVGASAAISGLVGLGVFLCPTKFVIFEVIPMPFVLAGALYLIANVTGLLAPSNIGYHAHLAGFATGAVMGLKWGGHGMRRFLLFIGVLTAVVAIFLYVGWL